MEVPYVDWGQRGVKVVPSSGLHGDTAQTPGMDRKVAVSAARTGAEAVWAGTVSIHAGALTGPHHHGGSESVIYVLSGRARMRWGDRLEYVADAGPGDFIFVPAFVPHQEINADGDAILECVVFRNSSEAVVVNLDIEPAEEPQGVVWVDPLHPGGT